MKFPKRLLSLAAVLTALSSFCSIASGYYHFVYFAGRSAPFNPIKLRFDLAKLTNNTVYFFVSDQAPTVLVPGDSFTAIVSELQLAAQAWNGFPQASVLQLAYGGLENAATLQSTPGIDVVFDDNNIAPGILAQTKVSTYSDVSFINSLTTSLPILRSRIQMRKDLTVTSPQQASYYDSSFTIMVHEFGHAIGLQHTLTSAAMATYITRSTTKAIPIAADDIAGAALLYPTPGYLANTGSIFGRVTLNGSGVNLASVVALSPTTGVAISNLTNPDGSYRIDAIPPGNYLIYVHPLPPPASGESSPDAIVLPQDGSQSPFVAKIGFISQFAGGTRDWTQGEQMIVSNGSASNVNFSVQGSSGPVVYGLQLSGGVNNAAEFSPMLEANGSYGMEFYAPGTLTANNQLAPGLSVSFIGNPAPASIATGYPTYYTQGFLALGVYTWPVQSTTPVAMVVNVSNDMYVLPAAFYVVPAGPPTISNMNQGTDSKGNPTLTVYGSSLSTGTRFVFDGTVVNSKANGDGSYTLSIPPAPGSHTASIEALNPDGQTSGQASPSGLPPYPYTYGFANQATINGYSPSVLQAGTDAMVQIQGSYTNFNSQTQVGFGSSDIVVKQIFVVSPTLLEVNVSVNPGAQPTLATITVTTGLQTASTQGMAIVAAVPGQITMRAPVTNFVTGLGGAPAGGTAAISVTPSPQTATGWLVTIGTMQFPPTLSNGQFVVPVPGGLTPGYVQVQLTSPTGVAIPPIGMKIDAPPPVIGSVLNAAGATVQSSSTTQVHPGDTLTLNIFGLSSGSILFASVGGILGGVNGQGAVNVPVISSSNPMIQVQLPLSIPTGPSVPLYVGTGTSVSAPFLLNVQN